MGTVWAEGVCTSGKMPKRN
jgi:hypothetical protein